MITNQQAMAVKELAQEMASAQVVFCNAKTRTEQDKALVNLMQASQQFNVYVDSLKG